VTVRKKRMTAAALIAAAAVILLGAGYFLFNGQSAPASATVDMAGKPVVFDPDVTPVPEAEAIEDVGTRFEVPSVSLNVPLGEMSEVDGEITPPGFTSAFLIRNRGVAPDDAAKGTVYVVMHSLRNGGKGPGNYLFDVSDGSSRVNEGDLISVAGTQYTVTKHEVVGKRELPAREDLWAQTPNRLIVVTCLQSPDGNPSTSNFVLVAEKKTQ
jgi:FlaG/FlaF family flagellin (archaellin)